LHLIRPQRGFFLKHDFSSYSFLFYIKYEKKGEKYDGKK
jgi:hypothetical protein